MGWIEYMSFVIVFVTVLLVTNMVVFQYYIEKKTQYKDSEFYLETTRLQISIMFLAVFWLFNMGRLREIRKETYMMNKYKILKINAHMFKYITSVISDEQAELKALDRYFKLLKIQKNLKKKKKW